MVRFWKELKYSLRLRKHIFFLLMIIMGLVSAVYLFRESLEASLEKAFPNDYGLTTSKTAVFSIDGSYAEHATAKDIDIQYELTVNRSLHEASWMDYEEGFLYELYMKDYAGPDNAVIGYGTAKFDANKAIDMDKGKYGKIQSAWLSQDVLEKNGFGGLTSRMFANSSSYTDTLYVMLGAGMDNGKYTSGSKITLRVEGVKVEAVVIGYLDPGTTLMIGKDPVCLDFYVICPLLDLSSLYDEIKIERPKETNLEPIYVQNGMKLLGEGFKFRDTDTSRREVEKDATIYTAVKTLWIYDEDIDEIAEVPEWLSKLRVIKASDASIPAFFGSHYEEDGTDVSRGKNIPSLTVYDGAKALVCNGFIPEGETFKVGDETINLDDYIVAIIPKQEEKKKEEAKSGEGEDNKDGKDQESGLQVEQRTILFRLLVMKNSGVFRTKLTADEAQRNLEGILDGAWENYEKDNPDLERTSSYVVHEADKPGSVIYREKIRNIPDKLTKVDSIGYFVCIVLLLLYLVYKFIKGSEFYTTLVLTGDTKLEIVLLFLAELAILFAFACGLAFGLSWIVCKLLGLGAVSIKPIVSKNLRVVLIPFIAIAALVIAKNYGKIFRRR